MGMDIIDRRGINRDPQEVIDFVLNGVDGYNGTKLVEAALVDDGAIYAALRNQQRVVELVVWLTNHGVQLMDVGPSPDTLAYKGGYGERGHPFVYSCPYQVLDLLGPAPDGSDWRDLANKHLQKKGTPKVLAWWSGGPTFKKLLAIQKEEGKYIDVLDDNGNVKSLVIAECSIKGHHFSRARLVQLLTGPYEIEVLVGEEWGDYLNLYDGDVANKLEAFAKEFRREGFHPTANIQEFWDKWDAQDAEKKRAEDAQREAEEKERKAQHDEYLRREALASKLRLKKGKHRRAIEVIEGTTELEPEVDAHMAGGFALYKDEAGDWRVGHVKSGHVIPTQMKSRAEARRLIAALLDTGINFDVPLEELKPHFATMKAITESNKKAKLHA